MRYFIFIFIVMVLNGHANLYPFNMSKQEYYSLSGEQRLSSWEKQAALKHKIETKKMKKKYKYVQKDYNPKLVVRISEGKFKQMKKGYYILPFELEKYEVKKIPVYHLKYNTIHHHIWVTYQDLGLYLGVKAHDVYKRKEKYISRDIGFFNKHNYSFRPSIVLINNNIRKNISKRVSFKNMYNANNLKVQVELRRKKHKYGRLRN